MLKINPYIILGASYEADIPSLSKLAKRRMRRLRLEGLEDSAEARAVDLALEAVRDPVQQFSLGLFALQLTSAEQEAVWNHPTLSKLSTSITSKDVDDMKSLLAPDAEGYDQSLAAMTLAQAVTALEEAQHGTPDDPADDLEAIEIWRRALTLFKRCTEKPDFGSLGGCMPSHLMMLGWVRPKWIAFFLLIGTRFSLRPPRVQHEHCNKGMRWLPRLLCRPSVTVVVTIQRLMMSWALSTKGWLPRSPTN